MYIYIYSIYPRGSNSDHKPGAQNEHQPNAENNKGLIIICIYIYTSNHNIFTRFDLQQRQKLDLGSKDFGWPGESFSCCLSCEFLFQGEPLSVSSLISFSHLSSFGFLNQSIHIIRWNTLTFRKWTLPNITWHCLTLPHCAQQCSQYVRNVASIVVHPKTTNLMQFARRGLGTFLASRMRFRMVMTSKHAVVLDTSWHIGAT